MPSADDFETRLTTVEREVARLRDQATLTSSDATVVRTDAHAARLLAAAADHDVSEVRAERHAHTQALNALRQTQLEQGQEITDLRAEMREGFSKQDRRIDGLEREMREGFATLGTGMAQITALLTNLGGSAGLEQGSRPSTNSCPGGSSLIRIRSRPFGPHGRFRIPDVGPESAAHPLRSRLTCTLLATRS